MDLTFCEMSQLLVLSPNSLNLVFYSSCGMQALTPFPVLLPTRIAEVPFCCEIFDRSDKCISVNDIIFGAQFLELAWFYCNKVVQNEHKQQRSNVK